MEFGYLGNREPVGVSREQVVGWLGFVLLSFVVGFMVGRLPK